MSSSSEVVVRVAFMQNGGNLAAAASAAAKEYKKIQDSLKLVNDPKYVQMLAMQETLAKKMGEVQIADAKQRLALLEKYGSVAAEQYAKEQDRARDRMRERVIRNQAEARWRTDPANRQAVFEESHAASQIARQNMEAQSRARREKEAYRGTPQGRQAIEEELRLRMQGRAEEADERRRQMREEMAYRKANPQAVDVERRARFEERHTQVEARTQDTREEVAFRKANPDVGQRETAENYQQGTIDAERQEQASGDQAAFMVDPANRDAVMNRMRTEAQERRNQGAVGLAQSQYRLEFDSTAEGDGYARDEIERKAKNRNVAMQAAAQASGRQADFAQSGKGQAAGLVQEKAARQDSMAKIRSEIALLQTRSKYVLDPKNRSALKEEIQLRQTLAAAMQRAKYTEQYGAAGGLMAAKDGAVAAGDAISGLFQKFALLTGAGVAAVATLDAPWAMLTHHTSMFGAEIGMMVIPAIIDLCRWLQDGADWVKGWDDGTKDAVSTTAKWAAAVVAASYAWKYLTPMLSGAFGILRMLDKGVVSVTAAAKALSFSYLGVTASSGPMNMALLSTIPKAGGAAAALSVTAAAAKSAAAAMWAFALSNPVTAIAAIVGVVASVAYAFSAMGSSVRTTAEIVQDAAEKMGKLKAAMEAMSPGSSSSVGNVLKEALSGEMRKKIEEAKTFEEKIAILEKALKDAEDKNKKSPTSGEVENQLVTMTPNASAMSWLNGWIGTTLKTAWPIFATAQQAIGVPNDNNQALQQMGLDPQVFGKAFQEMIDAGMSDDARKKFIDAVVAQQGLDKAQEEALKEVLRVAKETGSVPKDLLGAVKDPSKRDLTIPSTGFQSRQMDVFAMRDQIQMNLVRDQAEQERFEKQMRALNQIVNYTKATAEAAGAPVAPPPAGGAGGGGLD